MSTAHNSAGIPCRHTETPTPDMAEGHKYVLVLIMFEGHIKVINAFEVYMETNF